MSNENNDSVSTESIDTTSSDTLYTEEEQARSRGLRLFSRRGDSADEIDPRKLVRDPTVSELRWYYRRTFAKTLVDKPIEDAFKNGIGFDGPEGEKAQEWYDSVNYEQNYILAQQRARRDGFALLHIENSDTASGLHVSPFDVKTNLGVKNTNVLTIDDLCHCSESEIEEEVLEGTGLDSTMFKVRKSGIVINVDPSTPNFRDPIGYVLDLGNFTIRGKHVQFIHKDRIQHFVWNPQVSGDFKQDRLVSSFDSNGRRRFREERPLGEWEGDSVLVQSYDLFKGIAKGNWSVMQGLFRNAANMYTVEMPEDADDEDFDVANASFRNMNAKSEYVHPHGYEITQHSSGDMLDPQSHYDVMFDQILACHEMSKSVLFGTQSGVVSGSETDIKNYYNGVERFRETRAVKDISDFLTRAKRMTDGRAKTATVNAEVKFGPLFKLSKEDQIKMFMSDAQAVSTLINGYMLTPDEARAILSAEWSRVDLDNLTESQMDVLDRINLSQVGAWKGAERNEPDEEDNPFTGQNGGGNREGNRQSEFADSNDVDDMVDKLADKVLKRVNEKLGEM